MLTEHLYQPFEAGYQELEEGVIAPHKHHFIEMVFVLTGTGVQCLNQHKLPYAPDKLFLLMPQDCHSFEIHSHTRLAFIRFNNIYLERLRPEWHQQMEYIFQHNNHLPGCVLKNVTDKPVVRALLEALIRELACSQRSEAVVEQLINTVLTLVARNIQAKMLLANNVVNGQETAVDILHYIHTHIYDPELLKAEQIARHCNISPNYLSEYFKRKHGDSLQQYIMGYKLKLVETRLQYSNMRIGEIAAELGFTDESHLNRAFKKYKGSSPSAFRKANVTI
ncbi:AraC family transcriptional regulator [Chitinophaga pendula]|uniref:helix-turn-helix domain-containing protein n=1 Tax=Chitinophaga TaxID=79328 RepID=UPI000BAEBF33|nr:MULTISPECIES: AraC family transcriptional regulator [Chitinophaga]ASZ13432.1 AraC family transcriptional regulator [Chitinophaga sp. MD30]UCJ08942.1 AraC family transcriptional regulator [Chitinophaga pendula]